MPYHRLLTGDNLHSLIWKTYANEAARTGDSGLIAEDVGKLVWQQDNDTFWFLSNHSPITWALVAKHPVDIDGAPGQVYLTSTTSSTCYVGLYDGATGKQYPKTDEGIRYDALNNNLTISGSNVWHDDNLTDATTSQKGVSELATSAEALTGTDTTRVITPLALQAKIDALIAGSPETLNTLDEIAAAFNDDPNFATNIENLVTSFHGWSIQTADFTATTPNRYFVDTTGGAVTVTLPASPSLSDFVQIEDVASNFGTASCIIARNGQNIMGLAEDLTIATDNISTKLVFSNATHGWRLC